MRAIETNLIIMGATNIILDHQSRVVKIESWEDLIDEVKNAKSVIRKDEVGSLHGATIPIGSTIENFKSDDHVITCDFSRGNHTWKEKKLIYKCD